MVLFPLLGNAQMEPPSNLPNYDNKLIHYGFVIGGRTENLKLAYDQAFLTPAFDSLQVVQPQRDIALAIGFLIRMRLVEYLDVRLTPQVILGQVSLDYRFTDGSNLKQIVERTTVEFPLVFKYMSQRRGNIRMFLVGGVNPIVDVTGKDESISDEDRLLLRKNNLTLEFGFGADLYFPLFKFSPEIRYSKGLVNMLNSNTNRFSEPLDRLTTNAITLYLIFN